MIVSYNEVLVTCRKVFEALGLAVGDWEDSAEMVAWLTLHGLDGLSYLALALPHLETFHYQPLKIRLTKQGGAVDGAARSCLLIGPLATDWSSVAAHQGRPSTIVIENCTDQFLLIPYLLRVVKRESTTVYATWRAGADYFQLVAISTEPFPLLIRVPEVAIDVESILPKNCLQLTISAEIDAHLRIPNHPETVVYDIATMQKSAEDYLNNGITVDDSLWTTLQTKAKGVLVAASEQSRQQGAGEQA